MLDDIAFKPDGVTLSNLEYLSEEISAIEEQKRLEISDICVSAAELALSLSEMGLNTLDYLEYLKSEGLPQGSPGGEPIGEGSIFSFSGFERIAFSELFLSALEKVGLSFGEEDFLPQTGREESFTYVKNSFADEAYDVFSQDFSEPRISGYSQSFRECVAKVLDGECGYCILPFEEKGGVRLPSVSELLYTTELKINAVTPVFGFDGSAGLKYALVAKGFSVPERGRGDDRYLEIKFSESSLVSLTDLLSALQSFGLSVYRLNSVVSDSAQGSAQSYSIVIRDEGKSYAPLLVYLSLFAKGFVPIGLYKNLE